MPNKSPQHTSTIKLDELGCAIDPDSLAALIERRHFDLI
jgi:hypothetical protein